MSARTRSYWIAKAKLAGFVWFFGTGAGLMLGGYTTCHYAQTQITPRSVSVSGYTRANGTYVAPYSRRPPGAVRHDAPYELLSVLGGLVFVGGLTVSAYIVYILLTRSLVDLIPPNHEEIALGPPPQVEGLPTNSAVSNRDYYSCCICSASIPIGDIYWFAGRARSPSVKRHCAACKEKLTLQARVSLAEYEKRLAAIREQYRRKYPLLDRND